MINFAKLLQPSQTFSPLSIILIVNLIAKSNQKLNK